MHAPSSTALVVFSNEILLEQIRQTFHDQQQVSSVFAPQFSKTVTGDLKRELKQRKAEEQEKQEEKREKIQQGERCEEAEPSKPQAPSARKLVLDTNICPGSIIGFIVEHLPAPRAFVGVEGIFPPFSVLYLRAVQEELLAAGPSRSTGEEAPCRARIKAIKANRPPLVELLPEPSVPPVGNGDTRILNQLTTVVDASDCRILLATADVVLFLRSLRLTHEFDAFRPFLVFAEGHSSGLVLDRANLERRRYQWAEAVWEK